MYKKCLACINTIPNIIDPVGRQSPYKYFAENERYCGEWGIQLSDSINATNCDGYNASLRMATYNATDQVLFFAMIGANPLQTNRHGQDIGYFAQQKGNQVLLNFTNKMKGSRICGQELVKNIMELRDMLDSLNYSSGINLRGSINSRNLSYKNAMYYAVGQQNIRLMKLLILMGIDIFAPVCSTMNAFQYSVAMRRPESVRFLNDFYSLLQWNGLADLSALKRHKDVYGYNSYTTAMLNRDQPGGREIIHIFKSKPQLPDLIISDFFFYGIDAIIKAKQLNRPSPAVPFEVVLKND